MRRRIYVTFRDIKKSIKPVLLLSVCLMVAGTALAEKAPGAPAQIAEAAMTEETGAPVPADCYEKGEYEGNIRLPYRYYGYNRETPGEPVLVVYLHGKSGRGSDNVKQIKRSVLLNEHNYILSRGIKVWLLAPQCPADMRWSHIPGEIVALAEQFRQEHGCSKIYLTGESMGGTGSWEILNKYPGFAERAAIIASTPTKPDCEALAKTPVFAVVGDLDPNARLAEAVETYSEINRLDGDVRLKILNGKTHSQTCKIGMDKTVLDWLFS